MTRPVPQRRIILLQNKAATGKLFLVETPGAYRWTVDGTFGGTTASLEFLDSDGVTWISADTLESPGALPVFIEAGTSVRTALTGGSGMNLSSYLDLLA